MKKLLIVVTSIYFIFSAASAHAASGKAFIPHYESIYSTTEVITEFFLSNLTGAPIDVYPARAQIAAFTPLSLQEKLG